MEWYGYVLLVAGLLIVAFIFFLIGMLYRKKVAEREIGSAETEATRIINEAIKGGENKKREMLVEAKEEIHKSRTEYEKEVKQGRRSPPPSGKHCRHAGRGRNDQEEPARNAGKALRPDAGGG